MIQRRSWSLLPLACGLAIALASSDGWSQAKSGKVTEIEAKKVPAGAKDPNVKSTSVQNKSSAPKAAPPGKGGKKTRGDGPLPCLFTVDNWTPWKIQVFVDGEYRGLVDGYGEGSVVTGSGATLAYAKAEFEDGDTLTWGPTAVDCTARGSFTWKLK